MRVGVSLVLSTLFLQVIHAEVCPTSQRSEDLQVNAGSICEISSTQEVKDQIINDGTIIFTSSSSGITFNGTTSTLSIGAGDTERGLIEVRGSALIDASKTTTGSGEFKIEGQDIKINQDRSLTLKATKITFGAEDNKSISISGDKYVTSSTSYKNLILDTTDEITLKDLSLSNVRMSGVALKTLTNTKLTLKDSYITSDTELIIKSDASNASTFVVTKGSANTISAKTIIFNSGNATHSFKGEGIIDFQANEIRLGDSGSIAILKQEKGDKEGQTSIGFIADSKLLATKLEIDGLKMQVIKSSEATLSNIDSTFKGATLQALDRDNKDQILVIENGNSTLSSSGNIEIATVKINGEQESTTSFIGSEIKIYGQEISINGDANRVNTLVLQSINDAGNITLGKKNTDSSTTPPSASTPNKDGEVIIKGVGSTSKDVTTDKKNLQLKGANTIIGGSVTLQDLSIQTHSFKEGIVFSQGSDGELTFKGINLTSGIKDTQDKGNYQSLSFTAENIGKMTFSDSTSTLKASEFAFNNQDITLNNGSSNSFTNGVILSLYAMGKTSLDLALGEGMGVFSFDNTSIKNGSNATLALYGKEGAKIIAHHLTLDGVNLQSYALGSARGDAKNPIDLSLAGNDLTIKNNVTIQAQKFLYAENGQGIGADITIIGSSNSNALSLKADESSDSFTLGGTITLDNSSNGGSSSLLKLELGSNKTEDKQVALNIHGGLSAIGKVNGNSNVTTTTLKAKSFSFKEGVVVSSINGILSFESDNSGEIDISRGKVILKGLSNAEATITKNNGGMLKLGDVFALGKTKIENATFVDSHLSVESYGSGADTLTLKNSLEISGIANIDLNGAKIEVKSDSNGQTLKLNNGAVITSRGLSEINALSISTQSGSYSLNIQNGTLTLKESSSSTPNSLGSVTLGVEGSGGGNLVMANASNSNNDFSTPLITSYKDSTIIAKQFSFNDKEINFTSTGGELKLISKDTSNSDTLTIKSGEINLNNGAISYYKSNATTELKNLTLHNGDSSVSIHSQGDSFIRANELDLSKNTISSEGGFLKLIGLKDTSLVGNVTIGDHGGISALKNEAYTTLKIAQDSSLTLQANVPFTSSSNLLGGGKFGVLHAKSLEFEGSGGVDNPLIKIEILQKPIIGEEAFTLREGKQIVVETSEGIFKRATTTARETSKVSLGLEDIFLAPTGYSSLNLSAQLLDAQGKESIGEAKSIQVTLKALGGNAWDKSESISDPLAQKQMQTLIKTGRNEEILNNILFSNNAFKAGFSVLLEQGDVVSISNALNYISDTYTSLSNSVICNDRIQTQLAQMRFTNIANRLARGKNPHKTEEEFAHFIRSYHHVAYALSNEELPNQEDIPTHKGELWASYDGSMATGNGANSLVNGVMVGYDYDLSENVLLGGLVQYGYGSFDGNYLHTFSNNLALAFYTRMYFGGNELDVIVAENFGFNTTNIQVGATIMPQQLNGAMKYNLFKTTASLLYGYRFAVGEEESPYYLKPLVGIELSYLYEKEGKSNSLVPLYISAMHAFKTTLSVGMEMRKYFSSENYIFLTPMVMRDLYSGGSDAQVGFVDVKKMIYTPNYASATSLGLQAGGEGKVGENLSVNGSLGFRLGVEKTELLTNWSVGLKYKF